MHTKKSIVVWKSGLQISEAQNSALRTSDKKIPVSALLHNNKNKQTIQKEDNSKLRISITHTPYQKAYFMIKNNNKKTRGVLRQKEQHERK